jgi:hypothetical protein
MNNETGIIKSGLTYKASSNSTKKRLSGKKKVTMNEGARLSTPPINIVPSNQNSKMDALTDLIALYWFS